MKLKRVHEQLVEMRNLKPWLKMFGICSNLNYCFGVSLVSALALSWPDRDPDLKYPVGGLEEYSKGHLWDNPKRWELLEHCIKLTASVEVFPVEDFRKTLNQNPPVVRSGLTETIIRELLEQ